MATIQGYALQNIVHSLVALLVLEALVQIWRLRQPALRLPFHALVLILPALSLPLYRLFYPWRGSEAFRQHQALLDVEGWRTLEVGGWHPVAVGLGVILVATSLLFLLQEVLPALRLYWWHRGRRPRPPTREEAGRLEEALAYVHTPYALPPVLLVDYELPLAYAQGLARPALVLSPPLLHRLDPQELAGVLAHELAHLRRRDNWLGWPLLVLRATMFYNPVVLLVFRHILYDTERVCDDEAVALTGKPLALASGLLKVWRPASGAPRAGGRQGWLHAPGAVLGERSHQAMLEDRLRRLLHPRSFRGRTGVDFIALRAALATVALATLLFFVV